MIVSVTRDDLRDEFSMADEAFALSPISARAALPREEDYEAIREAFMETSRGRWFLGEYAKRNRNADTRMVLDAVARIEETLAAQQQPAPESGLAEALVAIRNALDEARAAASAVLDDLTLEETLAPVRKGARVIREISWRWREIGADARICDLIDSQVSAIEGACGQISSTDPRGALSAAFDLIEARIAEFGDGDTAVSQTAAAAVPPSLQTTEEASTAYEPEATMSSPAMAAEADTATAEAVEVIAGAADITVEAADLRPEAADAYDEALLDMVALEMAAPEPADEIDTSEIHAAEAPPAEPEAITQQAKPIMAPEPVIQPSLESSLESSVKPSLESSIEPSRKALSESSLGSTLIASGIVRRPIISGSDPLAPIRRMSQAEKIAFFS